MLTGESKVSGKRSSRIDNENADLVDKKNLVFSGTLVAKGKARGVVISTGMKTEMGKL